MGGPGAPDAAHKHSARRLFAVHALISLLPVVLIGLVLGNTYANEAERRGLDQARSHATLLSSTVVQPVLEGHTLRLPLTQNELTGLNAAVERAIRSESILRLRLRDLNGRLVYPVGAVGIEQRSERAAEVVGTEHAVAEKVPQTPVLTDEGTVRVDTVRVLQVLHSNLDRTPIGVLELHLAYDPIEATVATGTNRLHKRLAVGLAALYVVLAGLSFATTRRLRRHAATNSYLAEHDLLTGLPNRDAFLTHVGGLEPEPTDEQEPPPDEHRPDHSTVAHSAVAILDLDRFREINDTLGNEGGDELLVRLGRRIAEAIGPDDYVARLGGDEFGVVLADVRSDGRAHARLSVLRAAVAEPLQVGDLPLSLEVSIGYALVPDDGTHPETLLRHADIAMYAAKSDGTAIGRYSSADDNYDPDRLALVGEFQRALNSDELELMYQPKLDLRTGEVDAVEALLRWRHPRHGLLLPTSFLPVVEQTGLIEPLTDWVLDNALGQLLEWDAQGVPLSLAVNVSARNLAQPSFASDVLHAVRTTGIDPDRLVLEITETALTRDFEQTANALNYLRAEGVRLSVDDFGQGQTSLAFLAELPFSELKVDRSFVTTMCTDESNAAIVRGVVDLAHNLGMRVVAEGAEDAGTVQALREIGCDSVQGWTIARPMSAPALVTWLGAPVAP